MRTLLRVNSVWYVKVSEGLRRQTDCERQESMAFMRSPRIGHKIYTHWYSKGTSYTLTSTIAEAYLMSVATRRLPA